MVGEDPKYSAPRPCPERKFRHTVTWPASDGKVVETVFMKNGKVRRRVR